MNGLTGNCGTFCKIKMMLFYRFCNIFNLAVGSKTGSRSNWEFSSALYSLVRYQREGSHSCSWNTFNGSSMKALILSWVHRKCLPYFIKCLMSWVEGMWGKDKYFNIIILMQGYTQDGRNGMTGILNGAQSHFQGICGDW